MQVTTQAVRLATLALATGVGGPFNAVKAKLFRNGFSASDLSTAAQLDALAATFAGSAEKTIVWSGPAIGNTRQPFQESQLLLWICTADPSAPESIAGVYYVDGTDPTKLLGVDLFQTPVSIAKALDSVQWIATVP